MNKRQRKQIGKYGFSLIMGLLVGSAVYVEARRQMLKDAKSSDPGVGILVATRPLPSGLPIMLSDFTVRWVRIGPEVSDFYSDGQWNELARAKLICDLDSGAPLARACVSVSLPEKKTQKPKPKRKRTVVWTEIS